MRLRSLRVSGFKSFADRTDLNFRDGLTAVVGSNGCGKSNIADAVRWVLGEQRARALRGAKMEEVIFQGTRSRRPLNLAEVALTVADENGIIPIPQSELLIERKVFRDGGSEYRLNGNACRLRDIHDLLRDTGLGADAYSIIEGSMIETILSDRPDERRDLFEEAAGIGGYKDRRGTVLRQLEAAERDLARLDDLAAEVRSKVRSLARQRGKAQRHREMQARRLALDVAVAAEEMRELEAALDEGAERKERVAREAEDLKALQATEESARVKVRADASLLAGQRRERADALENVRSRLERREREVMLADQRGTTARDRLRQVEAERAGLTERAERFDRESRALTEDHARAEAALQECHEELKERTESARTRRTLLTERRRASDAAAREAREVARRLAERAGARSAAAHRREEAERQLAELQPRLARVEGEQVRTEQQTDLFTTQLAVLEEKAATARREEGKAEAALKSARRRHADSAHRLREAEDRVSRLSASVEARTSTEAGYEGFVPAVAAVMEARDRFPGARGPLADFVAMPDEGSRRGGRIDALLGGLLQALVVDDLDTVRTIRRWFLEEWAGGGSLTLLPLDAPALQGLTDAAPAFGTGPGAPWANLLLANFSDGAHDVLARHQPGTARVGEHGESVDARGVVRLGASPSGGGILGRREALARMRAELAEARTALEDARERREVCASRVRDLERRRMRAGETVRRGEDELRSARADTEDHSRRIERLARDGKQFGDAVRAAERTLFEALDRGGGLEREENELREASAAAEETADQVSRGLAELERIWEDAHGKESEQKVSLARAEAALGDAERALRTVRESARGGRARMSELDVEAGRQRDVLAEAERSRGEAAGVIESAFAERDAAAESLAGLEQQVGELEVVARRHGDRLREAARRTAELGEERHRIELEQSGRRAAMERTRERIELEWGRPWESLREETEWPEEGDAAAWKEEAGRLAERASSLGPINMLAIEEHDEEQRRAAFLAEQRDDLAAARDDLNAAVREINRTAREMFRQTFEVARGYFRDTFETLFPGGECDVWLADPDDPLDSAIEIKAAPGGKRTQRIHQLSGGERTLTALSLLFGIYLVKPSPFCILDEVDAPLDDANIDRFLRMLERLKKRSQFIVITHNPRTMEAADWLYGVTMEEPGVSRVVGVELEQARAYGEEPAKAERLAEEVA